MKPVISVIMPAYNAAEFLAEAIQSILEQTHEAFELIVTDDGSSDKTPLIIKDFAVKDDRVKPVYHQKNMGLVATLNEAVGLAGNEFIARMDADDIACPQRLEKQLDFLASHSDYAAVGCLGKVINKKGKCIDQIDLPLSSDAINIVLCLNSAFIHSGIMMRKSYLTKTPYNQKCWPVEDYSLWVELARHNKLKNLPERLVYYRRLESGISQSNSEMQQKMALEVASQHIKNLRAAQIIKMIALTVARTLSVHKLNNKQAKSTLTHYEAGGFVRMLRYSSTAKKPLVFLALLASLVCNLPSWRTYLHAWRSE